jgi:hypothetical protein
MIRGGCRFDHVVCHIGHHPLTRGTRSDHASRNAHCQERARRAVPVVCRVGNERRESHVYRELVRERKSIGRVSACAQSLIGPTGIQVRFRYTVGREARSFTGEVDAFSTRRLHCHRGVLERFRASQCRRGSEPPHPRRSSVTDALLDGKETWKAGYRAGGGFHLEPLCRLALLRVPEPRYRGGRCGRAARDCGGIARGRVRRLDPSGRLRQHLDRRVRLPQVRKRVVSTSTQRLR